MHIYVTSTQADALLPTGWEGEADVEDAVQQANIYLNSLNLGSKAKADPTPEPVLQAGAYAAQEAAQDELYSDQQPAVKSKSVTAGSVTSTKSYAEGSVAKSAQQQMIDALLQPYVVKRSATQLLGRL